MTGSCVENTICKTMVLRGRGNCDDFKFSTSICPKTCGLCGVDACEKGFQMKRVSPNWQCVGELLKLISLVSFHTIRFEIGPKLAN